MVLLRFPLEHNVLPLEIKDLLGPEVVLIDWHLGTSTTQFFFQEGSKWILVVGSSQLYGLSFHILAKMFPKIVPRYIFLKGIFILLISDLSCNRQKKNSIMPGHFLHTISKRKHCCNTRKDYSMVQLLCPWKILSGKKFSLKKSKWICTKGHHRIT